MLGAVEGVEYRYNDYYTCFINVSYVIKERGVFHTERTETGRFSTGRVGLAAGMAVVIQSVGNDTQQVTNN